MERKRTKNSEIAFGFDIGTTEGKKEGIRKKERERRIKIRELEGRKNEPLPSECLA